MTSNVGSNIKRPRGRPRRLQLQSRDDSTIKVLGAQSHTTKTQTVNKQSLNNLRGEQNTPNLENCVTKDDVMRPKFTQQAIAKSLLPINSIKLLPKHSNSTKMEPQHITSQNNPPNIPAKSSHSFSTYLSPNKDEIYTGRKPSKMCSVPN